MSIPFEPYTEGPYYAREDPQGEIATSGTDILTKAEVALLVEKCNNGDHEAWKEFYGRYRGVVHAAVSRSVPWSSEDTEDLVQEAFVRIFEALHEYDTARPLEAYVYEIAKRAAISHLRRATADKRGGGNPGPASLNVHDSGSDPDTISVPDPREDQESALMKAQQAHMIELAMSRLNENCRRLIRFRYDLGLGYREISEQLNITESTLRVQVSRCLQALARHYAALAGREG